MVRCNPTTAATFIFEKKLKAYCIYKDHNSRIWIPSIKAYYIKNSRAQYQAAKILLVSNKSNKLGFWRVTCCNCFIHSADFGSSGNNSTSFIAHKALVSQ